MARAPLTFFVAPRSSVVVGSRGYAATLRADAPVDSTHASFDDAYDAALALGGDRWVVFLAGGGVEHRAIGAVRS